MKFRVVKVGAMCLAVVLFGLVSSGLAEDDRTTTVGMPGRIVDLILPGGPLEVVPIERDAPMVVRIVQTIGHGIDQHRYEIEYYGLDPGEYDLADYLQRIDGKPAELPEIKVTFRRNWQPVRCFPMRSRVEIHRVWAATEAG